MGYVAERGLTKNQVIQELTRSTHGKLEAYVPMGQRAVREDPEFFAHLIAWNHKVGQVRDSKVALPIISLGVPTLTGDFRENSLAHLALLDPRNLVKAARFAKETKTPQHGRSLHRTVERYLRAREANWPWWERAAVAHRASLKELYALFHVKPVAMADLILFKGEAPNGTIFAEIAALKTATPADAAAIITTRKIPYLVAIGALGARAKDTDVVLAIIERMSATELVTNTKMLERLGVKTIPALRAAYEAGLTKAAASKRTTFKATKAAAAVGDEKLSEKLKGVQEKQIATLGGIEGNWLVLGDKSGSMEQAIEVSRLVSATLARLVKGSVHLVFFDVSPRYVDATGKSYDELLAITRHVQANGGTSIGCGLQYAMQHAFDIDGIAIVSDSAENNPPHFADVYQRFGERFSKQPPVYLYKTYGERTDALEYSCRQAGIDLQIFDVRGGVDYYSLPNLVQTMRANRYSLVDEIMAVPLLTLDEAFKPEAMGRA